MKTHAQRLTCAGATGLPVDLRSMEGIGVSLWDMDGCFNVLEIRHDREAH